MVCTCTDQVAVPICKFLQCFQPDCTERPEAPLQHQQHIEVPQRPQFLKDPQHLDVGAGRVWRPALFVDCVVLHVADPSSYDNFQRRIPAEGAAQALGEPVGDGSHKGQAVHFKGPEVGWELPADQGRRIARPAELEDLRAPDAGQRGPERLEMGAPVGHCAHQRPADALGAEMGFIRQVLEIPDDTAGPGSCPPQETRRERIHLLLESVVVVCGHVNRQIRILERRAGGIDRCQEIGVVPRSQFRNFRPGRCGNLGCSRSREMRSTVTSRWVKNFKSAPVIERRSSWWTRGRAHAMSWRLEARAAPAARMFARHPSRVAAWEAHAQECPPRGAAIGC
ncbi:hypothetical protein DFJ74DRAFT_27700 [Hyaloraphidium curvatum]|nr:hypothetical protein DFJ74DRAFT_27700 [Hyaloraphidium curvatum]